ncbi:MAG TPA: sigma-70 family RNA polymerase sigma factor [Vicinamibacterales bacterium]|nr:sigma-70 family RNA polymerase sigma factor [Vicinamibacterales bacterium]
MMSTVTLTLGRLPFMEEAGAHRPPVADRATSSDPVATVELVQKAKGGDQEAMDALFARYEVRLRRWAHGRLPAAARGALDTQDLVQDTLTRVFKRLHSFEPRHPGAFRDYVWTTLWNAVRDIARSSKRRGPVGPLDMDLAGDDPSPLQQAVGRETLDRYEAAMERLRPEEREAIVARIELGLSHAEVAEALGKPSAAAAHMAVSRALVRLAEEMAHDRKHAH